MLAPQACEEPVRERRARNENDTAVGELLSSVQTNVANCCFGCGPDNPSGLKLRFRKEGPDSVSTWFTPPGDWTGWRNILHGGFQALLLDETMAWVPFGLWNERAFVTKEMSIRYLRPVYVEKPLLVTGSLVDDLGREIIIKGEIRDEHGTALTEGRCTLVRLSKEIMGSLMTPERHSSSLR